MKPINLINLMNYVWKKRNECSSEEYKENTFNLLTHAFNGVLEVTEIKENNEETLKEIFICFQHILIYLTKCDNDFLQGEYDVYCKFCNWSNYEPLTINEFNEVNKTLTIETMVKDIQKIKACREKMKDELYEVLVLSLCYFSLIGDQSFDENEYYIIRCFFIDNYDYYPLNWENFKKEW